MKWISLALGVILVATGFVAFPSPPPPLGSGVMSLGLLLFIDGAWDNSMNYVSWGGLELRSDEIKADFYDIEHAKWRYLAAIAVAGVITAAFGMSSSFELQAAALVGGFALFGIIGFIGILKARQRVRNLSPGTEANSPHPKSTGYGGSSPLA